MEIAEDRKDRMICTSKDEIIFLPPLKLAKHKKEREGIKIKALK